ncbi:ATP-dependent RNA helicase A-like [Nilaparvata lugens]|uniref:ATP-dependent RNA helicase A-like n=1 Tax=Nilaparvata lugens TaxID=108931 RepID=UPI00193E1192|nr:ATP-dependent RNA helicase A-like [Nilaparvata lugens]
MREREKLPIYKHERKILKCIKDNAVTILKGSTGSGKSTQVCQYILDYAIESDKGAYCNIIVIEPKRICASTLAERVASERYEFLGQSVGYAVRFDSILPRPYGSILFCTPGYFLRRVENGLVGVSHIIVDEIHERGLETDYILMMLRMMLKSCSSLKVILMSADVNIDLFSSYFDGCAHITVHGNCYPVKEYFLEDCIELIKFKFNDPYGEIYAEEDSDACSSFGQSHEDVSECGVLDSSAYSTQTLQTLACYDEQAISSELIEAIIVWTREQNINGSILVFLPGWGDISKASGHLSRSINSANYCVLPLHSKIKGPEQKQVFLPAPPGKTKVILSTSLAESSVTIDDVICVIDSCKSRISISQDNLSFKFVSEWASKVNLNQRSGRAGRLRPGFCFRLCTKARYEELPLDIEPQMSRAPLYSLVLSLKLMKMGNIRDVLNSTLEPPPLRSIEEAERLLSELQCLDSRMELTPLGEMLGRLPLDPRVGRMLLMSTLFECPSQILKIAAYASVQEELFDKPSEDMKMIGKQRYSDHIAVLQVLSSRENLSNIQEYYQTNSLNLLDDILRIEDQLFTRMCGFGFDVPSIHDSMDDKLDIVTGLLCQAFYPNVCAVKPKLKKRVFQPNGKFGLISGRSLIGYSDIDFNPPFPIFIFGEQTETSINVCKNLTMVSPIHLLCFTNCKVVYENGVVKIDDWLPLKMDRDAAAALMCVRQMIEKALHDVVSHPSAARKAAHQRLATVVKQLCETDFDL